MMTLELFKTVIEIQSLFNMVHSCKDEITKELARIKKIEATRAEKAEELELTENDFTNTKKELLKTEKELTTVDNQLEKSDEHIKAVTSAQKLQSIEQNIAQLKQKKNNLENQILELMEKQECLQEEISTLKEFATGSLESLKEIKQEVETTKKKKEKEINGYEERIQNLLETCPSTLQDVLKSLHQQFKTKNIITYVENDVCTQCHFAVNRNLQSQIEVGNALESCPSCGRILIPQTARK